MKLLAVFIPFAVCVVACWYFVRSAKRDDLRRQAETERSLQLIRDELERRRQTSGYFNSQAWFDAECECIEIAERARRRASRQQQP